MKLHALKLKLLSIKISLTFLQDIDNGNKIWSFGDVTEEQESRYSSKKTLSISKVHIKVKDLTVGTIYTTRQEVVLFLFSVNSQDFSA